ncbi:hypothetical protein [Sphingomonas jatrophae]|uniref:Uncharacterized protein n=1 Tax=Sphingomonas jatrophae TaxID=1166337 RepID=A0A1I6M8G4_9SPHN|nr:hypothetical protein [Sphingomonas jatrophae]SFS11898.1 hypothetical protein SAMN05192580_3651 [Sphingomonas jatrophae]
MKFTTLFAAVGIVLAGFGASVPADAQPGRGDRWEQRRDSDRYDRRDHRRYDRDDRRRYGRDDRRRWHRDDRRGRRASEYRSNRRWANQRRCRPEWRNGQRIQVCG